MKRSLIDVLAAINEIRKVDGSILCRPSEMFMVQAVAAGQIPVPGDYAEVGVYKASGHPSLR